MLERFVSQADVTKPDNGHGLAAERIVRGFEICLKKDRSSLAEFPLERVQTIAQSLFSQSSEEIAAKSR